MKVFGGLCFPWIKSFATHKLDRKSTPCAFLGYSTHQSAYYCLDRETNCIYVCRHVFFDKTTFPFSKKFCTTSNSVIELCYDYLITNQIKKFSSHKLSHAKLPTNSSSSSEGSSSTQTLLVSPVSLVTKDKSTNQNEYEVNNSTQT